MATSGLAALCFLRKLISLINSIFDGGMVSTCTGLQTKWTAPKCVLSSAAANASDSESVCRGISQPPSFRSVSIDQNYQPAGKRCDYCRWLQDFTTALNFPIHPCSRSFPKLWSVHDTGIHSSHCTSHPEGRICEHVTDQMKSRSSIVSEVYVARSPTW